MMASGVIGSLRDLVVEDIAKGEDGFKPRFAALMDIVLAITRGKKVSFWSDDPEMKLLTTKFNRRDPIWNNIESKKATVFCRQIADGTYTPIKVGPQTFVMTEFTKKRNGKLASFTFAMDAPVGGYGQYHISVTQDPTSRRRWKVVMTDKGGFSNVRGSKIATTDEAIRTGLRALVAATNREFKTAIKKMYKIMGVTG